MSSLVIIKSFKNGLTIRLDAEAPFADIAEALADKFREAASFFKEASMVIAFEGRYLSEAEEKELITIIESNSQVKVLCLIGTNEETEKQFLKALNQLETNSSMVDNTAQFYKGSLKDGRNIETSESIIILGDIYPGCNVKSDKDIIVMGGLYGQATAGLDGESGHFIAALEMSPEKLFIGSLRYKSNEKSKWSIKPKMQPKIAYDANGIIQMENITKELLNSLPI